MNINIEPYTIQVRLGTDYVALNNISGLSLAEILQRMIVDDDHNQRTNQRNKSTISFRNAETVLNEHVFHSYPLYGKYGLGGNIHNYNRLDEDPNYVKTVEDVELQPYLMSVGYSDNEDLGLIIFSKYGNQGIKSISYPLISNVIKSYTGENYVTEIKPYFSREAAIEYIRNLNIKSLTIRKHNVPHDVFRRYGMGTSLEETTFQVETVIRAKRGMLQFERTLEDILIGENVRLIDIPEAANYGIDEDSVVLVDIIDNGKSRRLNCGRLNEFKPIFDITEDVELDGNNHPTFESISTNSEEYINNELENIYR